MAIEVFPTNHALYDRHSTRPRSCTSRAVQHGLGLCRAAQQGHLAQKKPPSLFCPRKRHPPGRDAEKAPTRSRSCARPISPCRPPSLPLGKHSGRAALRAKLKDLGFDMVDNQAQHLFVRFKALADRQERGVRRRPDRAGDRCRCGRQADPTLELEIPARGSAGPEGPQSADITLRVGEKDRQATAQGDGPVDAAFNAVKALYPNDAVLKILYPGQRGDRRDGRAGDRDGPHR